MGVDRVGCQVVAESYVSICGFGACFVCTEAQPSPPTDQLPPPARGGAEEETCFILSREHKYFHANTLNAQLFAAPHRQCLTNRMCRV